MAFNKAHETWIRKHLRNRKGEGRDRLKRGHGHGEKLFLTKVWWPLYGDLNNLHPEYEVADWRGMKFFIDLLYVHSGVRIAFEIKGYGPHVEQADRTKYRRELNRELFLQGLGYTVVSIAYDELENNTDLIKTMVKLVIQYRVEEVTQSNTGYSKTERDIMKLAVQQNGVLYPMDIVRSLEISSNTARKYMKLLVEKEKFRPYNQDGQKRVKKYLFIGSVFDI